MRSGATAVELLLAAAVLAACSVPVFGLFRQSQAAAHLDEFQVQGRRRAEAALAVLEGHRLPDLAAAATGGPPEAGLDPGLGGGARELYLPLPEGGVEPTLDALPRALMYDYMKRTATRPVRVFFEPLEPGLARLVVLVRWTDPLSRTGRKVRMVRFVADPYHWEAPR